MEHPTVTAVREFNAKHGEFYTSGSSAYYRDGSVREIAQWGVMYDATKADQSEAKQEWQVHSNIAQFYRIKLNQAVAEFDQINQQAQFWVPSDPDAEIAKLKRLRTVVAQRKQELEKAEAALGNTKLGRIQRERKEAEQERKQREAEFHQQRRAIRI